MEYIAWLFGEAWERQRRRRRLLAWAGLALCVAAATIYVVARPGAAAAPPPAVHAPAGTIERSPSAVFSQPPYMGVRCPIPNSIACNRVGLAIWLRHPAVSVRAWIDGRGFAMDWFGDERVFTPRQPRTELDGYLQPAGIVSTMHVHPISGTSTWLGDGTPSPTVWLLIDYGAGRYVVTHLQVPLAAGWG